MRLLLLLVLVRLLVCLLLLLLLLLLLFISPAALAARSSSSNNHTTKWEQSYVWPALMEEQYEEQTAEDSSLLRTFPADTDDWVFDYSNVTTSDDENNNVRQILENSYHRLVEYFENGIPDDYDYDDDENKKYPINPKNKTLFRINGIRLYISNPATPLKHNIDESYEIHIPSKCCCSEYIDISSITLYGALYGIETIKQLLKFGWMAEDNDDVDENHPIYILRADNDNNDNDDGNSPTSKSSKSSSNFLLTKIRDQPKYPYRGFMMDTSRHYLPLDLIKYNLPVLAANKLNVLHWHLTDSQSWPFSSQKYPELSKFGSYCTDCVYTHDDIQTVIDEAAMLGIKVIVELDLPGHSKSIKNSHPEYMCQYDQNSEIHEPLDVTNPIVMSKFVPNLYKELTQLFPDTWIHLGGDEVNVDCWKNSTKIQTWMKKHNIPNETMLLEYFENELVSMVVNQLDRRPIVWQDLFDMGVKLDKNVVVDVWKESIMNGTLFNATKAGYDVIVSACWYLDHLYDDWWKYHKCNPLDFANGTDEQYAHVLGGHASMWGERVDAANFFPRVWPRASAAAEVLWSGSPKHHGALSRELVQQRLETFRCYMVEQFRIPASPIGPGYCGRGPVLGGDKKATARSGGLRTAAG